MRWKVRVNNFTQQHAYRIGAGMAGVCSEPDGIRGPHAYGGPGGLWSKEHCDNNENCGPTLALNKLLPF
jgi:hypothetical protein